MSDIKKDEKPVSKKKLFGYFAAAYVGAAGLLVAAVLPAEYGIDPLGIGKLTGISKLSSSTPIDSEAKIAAIEAAKVEAPVGSFFERDIAYKTKTIAITIEDLGEVEHKLLMEKGDTVVFDWKITSPVKEDGVYYDFHGHPESANRDQFPEDFVQSYKTGEGASESGGFTAPFSGYHGLYLMNLEVGAVDIEWTISGYWNKDIELYRTVDGEVINQVEY